MEHEKHPPQDDIPDDETLDELKRPKLRTLAREFGIAGDTKQTAERLRRNLSDMRERGGIPVRCPTCGYTWVYNGEASYRTSCPRNPYHMVVIHRQRTDGIEEEPA